MDEYHTKHTPWFQASVEAFAAKAAKEDLARADDPNTTPNPDMIVAARLRPMLEDEVSAGLIRGVFTRDNTDGPVDIHQIRKHIKPLGPPTLITTSVALDRAYGPEDTSEKIHQDLVEPLVPWAWSGGVSTMFAYGQTGSGKRNQKLASSADLNSSAAKLPFKERIRPGMVVRWNPPADFSDTLPGLNMAVILCPQLAAGSNARDLDGNQVNGEIADEQESNSTKYLCAMVLPGFMADSYEINMWRQVVVDVEQMEAEVLLEYDSATRYCHVTV